MEANNGKIFKIAQGIFDGTISIENFDEEFQNKIKPLVAGLVDREINESVSAKDREKYAKSGIAMKDGSFPISNEKQLSSALKLLHFSKHPIASKKHIIKRAKALGLEDMVHNLVNESFEQKYEISDRHLLTILNDNFDAYPKDLDQIKIGISFEISDKDNADLNEEIAEALKIVISNLLDSPNFYNEIRSFKD